MHRSGTIAVLCVVITAGVLTGISFCGAVNRQSSSQGTDRAGARSSTADSERLESGAVLSELATSYTSITSVDDLTLLLEASIRTNSVVGAPELEHVDGALEHVSQMLWARFYQSDAEVYRAWRISNAYETPSTDRLANLRLYRHAGLKADDPPPTDWFTAIWSHSVASSKRPDALSSVAFATSVVSGVLTSKIPIDPTLGHVRPFPHLLPTKSTDDVTSGLAAQQLGSGWPFWLPPVRVLDRISRPGTHIVEVRVVPVFTSGEQASAAAISFVLARDPTTERWWIVQFYVFDVFAPSTAHINGHLL